MVKVGEISEICRYPVKGMAGEALPSALLSAQGLPGDRIWVGPGLHGAWCSTSGSTAWAPAWRSSAAATVVDQPLR